MDSRSASQEFGRMFGMFSHCISIMCDGCCFATHRVNTVGPAIYSKLHAITTTTTTKNRFYLIRNPELHIILAFHWFPFTLAKRHVPNCSELFLQQVRVASQFFAPNWCYRMVSVAKIFAPFKISTFCSNMQSGNYIQPTKPRVIDIFRYNLTIVSVVLIRKFAWSKETTNAS